MKPLRILITNNTLDARAGSELYVKDLAIGLLRRGHQPVAYSTVLGGVAEELRRATVPAIDSLDLLGVPPDLIHGHHHLDTMTALLRFPGVPAVSFCHGWLPWQEAPPRFPRILRYVAVDEACRDRLVFENGIPENRVRVILNFVDLERFQPRPPLPQVASRALVLSNTVSERTGLGVIREACARTGLLLDVVGLAAGNPCPNPESLLHQYDIVFAKARCALEALAVGAAVIACDAGSSGPMVTLAELPRLRRQNFGVRALTEPLSVESLIRQIQRYDPQDAVRVSETIRATAGLDPAVDHLVSLYGEVIAEHAAMAPQDCQRELRAAAVYLERWGPGFKALASSSTGGAASLVAASAARGTLTAEVERLQAELNAVYRSLTWRLTQGFLGLPILGTVLGPITRWLAHRFGR